jgi:hypothetical protein
MKSSGNSVDRRYCTFVSSANRESLQTTMKVQGLSSTTRTKKAQQVLTHLTDKSTSLIRIDANHRKTGIEISDLHGQKLRT